jgi:hypothetical protein
MVHSPESDRGGCGTRDSINTGYNETAANATRRAVKDFVRTAFKLE